MKMIQNIVTFLSILIAINVLLLVFSVNGHAQILDLNSVLPIDQTIKKGTLENGMTYYIHKTDVTKGVASYYIIQNVGSVLEEDNQSGLAHFLEHMAFNGTENFKSKGILDTLQKQGLVFGRDINAYTSFDETVYNVDNLPTTDENISLGLQILHDWSNYLLLTEEEIDAERGVIKEEWRTRQNGQMRVLQQSLPTLFNNSKYAQRLPIGTMDVVENFKYKALRDFYHDWYRTDLQAIAIVGDIDIETMEKKIKALFSNIPAVKTNKTRPFVHIPDNQAPLYHLALDDEVTTSKITFGIRHSKPNAYETIADLQESLLNIMLSKMLSARLDDITQTPEAPFLGVRLGYGSHTRTTNTFSVNIYPKPNQQQDAFKVTITEINRAVKHGFTKAEVERTLMELKKSYENQISKKEDRSHGNIINSIKQDYLEHITIADMDKEYELAQQIFSEINLDPALLHRTLKKWYTKQNRYVMVTGVKGHNNLSKIDALQTIEAIEADTSLIPYEDAFAGKTLLSGMEITPGSIVSESILQVTGSTSFTLSNGIKVHYKFADKNKNDVNLNAISYGGLSLVADSDLPSAQLLSNVISLSGLGAYSATNLKKILAGKTAKTQVQLSNLTESIAGASTTDDVETLLQMVHLRFVNPRFDPDAYQVLMENLDNYVIRRSETINEKISDSVTVALYGNKQPKRRLFNTDFVKDVSFEQVKSVYEARFNNAADFEFFIVGDVQLSKLRPLLKHYIASIPTNNQKEKWQNNALPWLQDTTHKAITLTMEDPKSAVRIGYKNNMSYSLKNNLTARALGDILNLRFTETLREEEGGTYGASASAHISKRPTEEANLQISFDCNPDKVETLIGIVHKELNNIAEGQIKLADLEKTTTSYLKKRKEQQDYNSYDMRVLTNYFREGYNMNDPENFESIIDAISIKEIQAFAKTLLENSKSYEIVFHPN